jgi:hypothetical protein
LLEPFSDEIKDIYQRFEENLGLRKKDISKTRDGGENIDTNIYHFAFGTCQNPKKPKEVLIAPSIILLKDPEELPNRFERNFPNFQDEIVIPINGEIDFAEMVEKLEEVEIQFGRRLI